MAEREKVIERLGRVSYYFKSLLAVGWQGDADIYREHMDSVNMALAMLKEQEARVMTLDEVKTFDWDYCYLEEERLPGKEYRSVCGDYALTCITWPCIASMRIQHGDDNYGKKWRCWSAKPTDEQRQAVKWDDA